MVGLYIRCGYFMTNKVKLPHSRAIYTVRIFYGNLLIICKCAISVYYNNNYRALSHVGRAMGIRRVEKVWPFWSLGMTTRPQMNTWVKKLDHILFLPRTKPCPCTYSRVWNSYILATTALYPHIRDEGDEKVEKEPKVLLIHSDLESHWTA